MLNQQRKIGVFIPDIQTSASKNTLKGIIAQARNLGYDVMAFTHFINNDTESSYIRGQENIYNLAMKANLDGVILVDDYRHRQLGQNLETMLEQYKIPAVAYGYESKRFPSIRQNDDIQFKKITEHMIKVHNCRNILCLTGTKGYPQSEERLKAYIEVMRENSLDIPDEYVVYGDFWKNASEKLAEKIYKNQIKRPDAVVCANDVMAMFLINELMRYKIRVPEDIRVCGYDYNEHSVAISPTITTISRDDYNTGAECMCMLNEIITKEKCTPVFRDESICCGRSCGCTDSIEKMLNHNEKHYHDVMRKEGVFNSDMKFEMMGVHTVDECMQILSRYMYLYDDSRCFYICLCDDWMQNHGNGYPDFSDLRLMISKENSGYAVSHDTVRFETSKLLPNLEKRYKNSLFIFTPLNFQDKNFGYCVTECDDDISFSEYYAQYCYIIEITLEQIRLKEYEKNLKNQLVEYSARDAVTGLYNINGLLQKEEYFKQHFTYSVMLCIENMEQIIYEYGRQVYDMIVISSADALNVSYNNFCGRLKENIFIAVFTENSAREITGEKYFHIIQSVLDSRISKLNMEIPVNLIYISKDFSSEKYASFEEYIESMQSELNEKLQKVNRHINSYQETLKRLRRDIYEYPEKQHTIESLAKEVSLSNSQFQRLYNKQFETSCKQDIINAQIEKAKILLDTTNMTVNEIAVKCGYNTAVCFMRQFKKKTEYTPSEYRKRND